MLKRKLFGSILLIGLCLVTLMSLASCNAAYNKGEAYYPESAPMEDGFTNTGKNEVNADLPQRKIIKTYDLSLETKTFDESLQALMTMLAEQGGYVESSDVRNQSLNNSATVYSRYAKYTLRVPAEKADAFVNSIGTAFHMTGNTSTVQDVSDTYYSIEAVLEELEAERDSLLAMMASLDSKSDYNFWLTLQQRLSEIKQEIAVYRAQLNSYDSKVEYSTLRLSITEVVTYTAKAENGKFGSRISAAFRDSWSDFAEGCQDFAIFIVEAIPTLLVLGVIALVLVLIFTRIFRDKKKKKGSVEPTDPSSKQ